MANFQQDLDPDRQFYKHLDISCDYFTEDCFKNAVVMEGYLSIIHLNIRSMWKNINKLKDFLQAYPKFSIIAVSETWLDSDKIADVQLEGYELFTVNRQGRSGGVALYVDSTLKCKYIEDKSRAIENVFECVTVDIGSENVKTVQVTCIYRNQGTPIDIFNEKFDELISLKNTKEYIVCGDFNINLLNVNEHGDTADFLDMMYSNMLCPVISKPTRITTTSSTLIDHIFTNKIDIKIVGGLLISDIGDHLPVFAVFQNYTKQKNETKEYKIVRDLTPQSIQNFKQDLNRVNWNYMYSLSDPNIAYDMFLQQYIDLYNDNCPNKRVKVKNKNNNKPWLTKGLRNACKKKNLLYKKFITHRTKEAENKYRIYKNKLVNIIRSAKKIYFHNQLEMQKHNIKGTWGVINRIIKGEQRKPDIPKYFENENDKLDNIEQIVDGFNKYFVNVGYNLAKAIDNNRITTNPSDAICSVVNSFYLSPTNAKEIINVVNKFQAKMTKDTNDIDMKLIKETILEIAQPLTFICNLSFQTGIFPDAMKTARVTPIFKHGDKHTFSNYRPISVLPQFSKIIEKIFVCRLDKYLEKFQLLNDHQYGFRNNRSTSMAIMDLIENISTAIDSKQHSIGIFLDLKKAFDTLDHNILLQKLEKYGFRGPTYRWLQNYLLNRYQYVQIDNCKSEMLKVRCGIPQGSIIGPKLFIIYINDLGKAIEKLNFVQFADDTTLYSSGKDLNLLLETVEKELHYLKVWFDINKLSLNIEKTKIMLFSNRNIDKPVVITLSDKPLEQVYEHKFLGVTIDHNMNWKPHIKNIKAKVSKLIALLYKSRHNLTKNSLLMIYNSLIMPYITYAMEIWGNTYKTNTQQIFRLQKKAVRAITFSSYNQPTHSLFKNLQILKFYDLVDLYTLKIMFKVKNRLLPVTLLNMFKKRYSKYELRGVEMFEKKGFRTNTMKFCVSVKGVDLWNNSPDEIKLSNSVLHLKRIFKKIILNKYKDSEQ